MGLAELYNRPKFRGVSFLIISMAFILELYAVDVDSSRIFRFLKLHVITKERDRQPLVSQSTVGVTTTHPITQPLNHSISQSINKSIINQLINSSTNQSINHPITDRGGAPFCHDQDLRTLNNSIVSSVGRGWDSSVGGACG